VVGLLAANLPGARAAEDLALSAAVFILILAAAENLNVRLASSRPGATLTVSASGPLHVAIALLFPTHWAVFITAFGFLIGELLRGRREGHKLLFNTANMTLSVAAASGLWQLGTPVTGLGSFAAVPWVILATLMYFAVNTLLNATIVALVLKLPISLIWWRSHRRILLSELGLHAMGVPIAGLWIAFPWMLPCFALGLLALHRAIDDRVKLETQTLESLFQLADILDARDKYTHGHSERVGYYAEQLAIQLRLSSDRAHLAFLAGRLHDIGKCAISNEVLRKPGALDHEEQDHMRQHPSVGGAMLGHFSLFQEVARFVRGHHERWDGKGYPDALRAEDIPLESRIISVVDSYDAMTTTRPYRAALGADEAVRRLRDGAGQQWDPQVVTAFLTWLEQSTGRELAQLQTRPATVASS
jgi:putative nucleotidyltransferase with HDIG domain